MPSLEKSTATRPPPSPPSPVESPPLRRVDAAAPLVPRDIRDAVVIKQGDLFLLTDLMGNVPYGNADGLGLYLTDTRYLSALELVIEGLRPTILLSSSHSNLLSEQVLTNPNVVTPDARVVPEQTIGIRRYRRLVSNGVRESLNVENFNTFPLRLNISVRLAADFADIFEIRGLVAPDLSRTTEVVTAPRSMIFRRRELDGTPRETRVLFDPAPDAFEGDCVIFALDLPARGSRRIAINIELISHRPFQSPSRVRPPVPTPPQIESSNSLLDDILLQSRRDLQTLMSGDGDDTFVSAGVPWYAALFGRDALITALLDLWANPSLARHTLRLLAARQSTQDDPWRDQEPGKVLHELRRGELARLGAIPFAPYYGTVDATPLWIHLLAEYARSTNDLLLVRSLLPNLEAALGWLDRYADLDGDGFIEYKRRSASGLIHQGWKDSWDGITHANGTEVGPPIALVEAQAYAYAARRGAAWLFRTLGQPDRAEREERAAATLAETFNQRFWMAEEQFYCLALDGRKDQVRAISSNPGHALMCGIVPADRAEPVAQRLMSEDLYSGWGVRTLSSRSARYNPTGYHTGTVWPHDNALIALGLKRYGFESWAEELAGTMLQIPAHFPNDRMPELFCGFARSAFHVPVRYPVACSPQAWAAASCSAFLQVLLGLRPYAPAGELRIIRPRLPSWLQWVRLSGLSVGEGVVDLHYQRAGTHTSVDVTAMRGDVRVTLLDRWEA